MERNYKDKEKNNNEYIKEDTTKYGEFVSSYFTWLTLDGQKKRAKELDEMTKNKKD